MAYTAIIERGNMINRLGRCDTRIMAGCTVVRIYTRMIKGNARKGGVVRRYMARRTIHAGRYMIQRLTRCNITVMA